MPTNFASVVRSWRTADPSKIHPTREHESEMAYWDSGKRQAEFVAALLPNGGTVLDFGCGDGRIAIPLAQLGFEVCAIDAAPEMIERLDHQIQVQGVRGVTGLVSDGIRLQPSFTVDAVNARAVFIHHAHTDVAVLVRNLSELLKPGGLFIADWPLGPHHERTDWIDVTTWDAGKRQAVADAAGLELVSEGVPAEQIPSVWRKK